MKPESITEDMSAEEITEQLLEEYKDDKDVLEVIQKAKADMEYLAAKNTGQTQRRYAISLAGHLELWFG